MEPKFFQKYKWSLFFSFIIVVLLAIQACEAFRIDLGYDLPIDLETAFNQASIAFMKAVAVSIQVA